MTGFQKVAVLIAITGLVTTLVYPTHKTAQVATAAFKGFQGAEHTVITGAA
jgi:hypothetical protein